MEKSSWPAEGSGPDSAGSAKPFKPGAFVPLCLVVYFLVGYARIRTTDWIPFSAWALFVFVPNHPSVYAAKIESAGDRVFDPPLDFTAADGVVKDAHDITATFVINKLGAALERGDTAAAQGLRGLLEKNSLPPGTRWRLVKQDYDPLERWKTGRVNETPLAEFAADRHD